MQTVRCPACRRTLTLDHPVAKAKLRCPACGEVFVASAHASRRPAGAEAPPLPPDPNSPAGLASAAADTARAKPKLYHHAPKRGAPKWIVIPFVVGGVALIGVIVALIVKGGPERVVVRRKGPLPPPGPGGDAESLAARQLKDALRNGGGGGDVEPGVAAPPRGRQPIWQPQTDDRVVIVEADIKEDTGVGSRTVTGKVRNRSPDRALTQVTVAFDVVDAEGKPIRPQPFTGSLSYVPPNGVLPFSVELTGVRRTDARIRRQGILAHDWTDEGALCLPVERHACDIGKGEVRVTGSVKNTTARPITRPRLYCDVEYKWGAAKALELKQPVVWTPSGQDVKPGEVLSFEATFLDPTVWAAVELKAYPRIVCR